MAIDGSVSIQVIEDLLGAKKYQELYSFFVSASISDITKVFYSIDESFLQTFVNIFLFLVNKNNLLNLDPSRRDSLFALIDDTNIERLANNLDFDSVLGLLDLLNLKNKKRVLNVASKAFIGAYKIRARYVHGQIGHDMSMNYITVPTFWSFDQASKYLVNKIAKNIAHFAKIAKIFIINQRAEPVGYIGLAEFFTHNKSNDIVENFMNTDFRLLKASASIHNVVEELNLYRKLVMVVVDDFGKMLGTIESENVITVISEKAYENVLDIGGVGDAHDGNLTFLHSCFDRFKWLFVALANSILSALVVSKFAYVIEEKVILAVMMPIIASLGGNVGIQTLSVVLRSFNKGIPKFSIIFKEVSINVVNGILFGSLSSLLVGFILGSFKLGLVVACSMFFNMVWSSMVGSAMPMIISKLGYDETISSGPVITSLNDVFGFAIFLGLASMFL